MEKLNFGNGYGHYCVIDDAHGLHAKAIYMKNAASIYIPSPRGLSKSEKIDDGLFEKNAPDWKKSIGIGLLLLATITITAKYVYYFAR